MTEKDLLAMPGYDECQFLLVLKPHQQLWNNIMKLKEEFSQKFECRMAFSTKPHITIAMFQQYEMMQQRIIQKLQTLTSELSPIKIELKDFGSFPSHTIYINVLSKIAIMNTVKQIRQAQHLMKIDKDHKPYFITEPHLTVARKLLPWQYEKAWLEYNEKKFTGRFIAENMIMLKRKAKEMKYEIAEVFAFKNLKSTMNQGELFG